MKKKSLIVFVVFSSLLFLGACSKTSPSLNSTEKAVSTETSSNESEHGAGMRHSGQIPTEMVPAANPKYPVGTSVTITTGHMDGMMNAKATVTAAYDTTIYEETFTPTNGGKVVKNHKWVVQEELEDKKHVAKPGEQVVIKAGHMDGMMNAKAIVDKAMKGTVYVVDYEPTNGSDMVKNHMWVTESELKQS